MFCARLFITLPSFRNLWRIAWPKVHKLTVATSPLLFPLACEDVGQYADLKMNDPFDYTPHPLCLAAVRKAMPMIEQLMQGEREGKMFGVLVVRTGKEGTADDDGELHFLVAYSGQVRGRSDWPGFVPAVFDYLQPDGYFKQHEAEITKLNREISRREQEPARLSTAEALAQAKKDAAARLNDWQRQMFEARERRRAIRATGEVTAEQEAELIRESQFMKAEYRRMKKQASEQIDALQAQMETFNAPIGEMKTERRRRSDELQQWLFSHFEMVNSQGERRNLIDIFRETSLGRPPSGAGECCEPKLLQYAHQHGLQPVQMAMLWVGPSPKVEIRHHGRFYPACRGKCLPILTWMGYGESPSPQPHPAKENHGPTSTSGDHGGGLKSNELPVLYEDDEIVVVNKPAGLLTIPGISEYYSVWSIMRSRYPDSDSPFIVHRLDQPTSGLLVISKTRAAHRELQRQFMEREVQKRYVALLERSSQDNRSWSVEREVRSEDSSAAERNLTPHFTLNTPHLTPNSLRVIALPLYSDPLNRPYQSVDRERGKAAVTEFEIIGETDGHARVALWPKTGRTHQLRVHCAHADGLGNPILGDMLYGSMEARRLFLHAESISFRHPRTGEPMTFSAPAEF